MNRQEKQAVIDTLKGDFANSKGSFLVAVQGMTVSQIQNLRKDLRQQGGMLKVAKNTLLKIAAEGVATAKELVPYFKEQVGIVFIAQEAPAVAKVLHKTAQDNTKLKVVVGIVDAAIVNKDTIAMLALLPSREVLIARICGALKAPAARIAFVAQQRAQSGTETVNNN